MALAAVSTARFWSTGERLSNGRRLDVVLLFFAGCEELDSAGCVAERGMPGLLLNCYQGCDGSRVLGPNTDVVLL
eukprot:m.16296 g.16296  ORF g.16296 m.16296 type:complete len:75 (-) comp8051_c0_seq1:317-541(-)